MKLDSRTRIVSVGAAVAVTVLASLAGATPAAAVSNATVVIANGLVVSPTTVNLIAGDTLSFKNNAAGNALSVVNGTGQIQSQGGFQTNCASAGASSAGASCPVADTATTSFTVVSTGTVVLYRYTSSAVILSTITIGSGADSSSGTATPPPVIQQFGMPSSGTCDAAAPVMLNWGGAGSGGWGNSWAQWANGGNGGPVCTRTLVYSNSASRWIVG